MSFVPSFGNLRRLLKQTAGSDLYTQLQELIHSQNGNMRTVPEFTKKICSEIRDFAREANSPAILNTLVEFLEGAGHNLSKIKQMKDNTQKQNELLQLLMSQETAKFISDRVHWYLNNAYSSESDESKQKQMKSTFEQRAKSYQSDLTYGTNQASCDPIGRIVKRCLELLTTLIDLSLINAGSEPLFANSAEDAIQTNKNSLARPPIVDPDPMSMRNRIFGD